MAASKMSLKLLIDSKHNRVVFAEAGKEFVDFLLSLLALPVGTIIRLLTKSTMIGCIANLYGSIEKLDESYMQPNQNKDSILNPTITTQSLYMSKKKFVATNVSASTDTPASDQAGGYVKGLVTYMVTDDLSVSPMSMVSVVGLLNKIEIKDFSVLEEKVVEFGIDEGLELLKASLLSKDALSAVFLPKLH
uniref:DUF674 domain-containing protein n=1 Tax=Populus alba TaxID=43335 RepID=A0A4V6ABZ4_POPAL|nr:hypothetical protein D5086_0000016870 [Populus alba]